MGKKGDLVPKFGQIWSKYRRHHPGLERNLSLIIYFETNFLAIIDKKIDQNQIELHYFGNESQLSRSCDLKDLDSILRRIC